MGSLVIGVDGGPTQTVCVALDLKTRQVLGRSVGASANWSHLGVEGARAELWKTVRDCMAVCKRDMSTIVCLCIGTAGVESTEDVTSLQTAFKADLPHADILIYTDAVTALASGTGGVLHGCVLIAGTGTVAFGMVEGRLQARASGWGPAFMDGGSGHDLGSRALAAVSKSYDHRGAATSLVDALLKHLHLDKPQDLIRWVYAEEGVGRIAGLAPLVVECAVQGDAVADTILKHGVGELFRSVKAVATQLGLERTGMPFRLVLAGGLLTEGCLYTQYLLEVLKENIPTADICYPAVEPAEAATWLAYNYTKTKN